MRSIRAHVSPDVSFSSLGLVGQSDTHLCTSDVAEEIGARIHVDALDAFARLRDAARAEGFDLRVLSGFRSFEQQLSIWNRKATGQLAVLDGDAVPLDIATLSEEQLVFAILRWSALPGASRHHWGTDIDVYDAAAKPEDYVVDLVPAEVNAGGMFAPMHEWLDARIAARTAFGFFRPYDVDRHGVAPERWHLSYGPISSICMQLVTPELLRDTISGADMRLKDIVLAQLETIHSRFVTNTNQVDA
jgi:LAS superfamily LD-carboxypeptidase LdcB